MNNAADPVLELLDEHDIPMPPKLIEYVLNESSNGGGPSYRSILRATDDLEAHGLIRKVPETSYYEITSNGRDYLRGNLDAKALDAEDT